MKIAVRMDDITPDMNWENFEFFQGLFEKAGITPLLGIVPQNRDENLNIEEPRTDFWNVMKLLQKKGYVMALHGCHHVYRTQNGGIFPLNDFSEFAGIDFDVQKKDLQTAKCILENNGISTDIFMAPAHSYDKNTLKALKELGFTKITDGFGNKPYIWKEVTFYPISFLLSKSLKSSKGYTTMVIHANTVTDKDKERYVKLFDEYGKDMISYKDYMEVTPAKRSFIGRSIEYLMAKSKFWIMKIKNRKG